MLATSALTAAVVAASLLSSGCAGQRAAVESAADTTSGPISTGRPIEPLPEGMTIGERLGQLDALMRTAPPDSLEVLREEYDRLLAARAGESPRIATGGDAAGDDENAEIVVERIPIDDADGDAPSRSVGDPARQFRGLSARELATIPGHARIATSPRRSSRSRSGAADTRSSRARSGRSTRDDARLAARKTPRSSMPAPSTDAATINARGERKELVAGIAAARAGKYSVAVTKLEPSVNSGKATAEAKFLYALSLEKTGKLDRAADEYLRASRGSGALAQRSYIEYCRLLARTGERRKARELITQFLKKNPESQQAVAARRLLQTM